MLFWLNKDSDPSEKGHTDSGHSVFPITNEDAQ